MKDNALPFLFFINAWNLKYIKLFYSFYYNIVQLGRNKTKKEGI